VLNITGTALVLWLHVLAACIWIGGQIAVATLIPLLRGQGQLAGIAGRRYQAVAWPAFGVLVATGIINVGNAGIQWRHLLDTDVGRTLAVKLGLVATSGLAAGVHAFLQAPRRDADAVGRPWAAALLGSVSVLAAVLAALYGVVIASA
jgi:putative copper export protein